MASITVTKEINAPIAHVFSVLSNIPEAEKTISGITKIEMLTDGPVGVGTRWKETRVMFGKEAAEEMEITEFNPNRNYVVEAESCGAHFRTDLRFHDKGSGTLVEMEISTQPVTFMAKLMSPLGYFMKDMMVKCLEKDLEDSKRACERRMETALS